MESPPIGLLLLNICATVCIVSANKLALDNWPYTIALTFIQAVTTKLFTCFVALRVWPSRFIPEALLIATTSILSISLLNHSLHVYGVVVYQVCKAMMVPCTALLETVVLRKRHCLAVWAAVSIISAGSFMASELDMNAIGSLGLRTAALLPVIGTILSSATYVLCAWVQKAHQCAPLELVSQQMTWQIPLSAIAAYATHGNSPAIHLVRLPRTHFLFVLASCALACAIQWTAMMSVFKSSALTVIVAGQLKLIASLIVSMLVDGHSLSARALLGFLFISVGTSSYGYLTAGRQAATPAKAKTQ